MDSILNSIKKLLGIESEYKAFDVDIIIGINSAIMVLEQLGVGPFNGFAITGETEKWLDFLPSGRSIEAVKSYIYLKVRVVFDPPTSAFVLESMNKQMAELEWRICAQVETPSLQGVSGNG